VTEEVEGSNPSIHPMESQNTPVEEFPSGKVTVQDLYDHIVKHMTPEDALKKLLVSSLLTYEKLKFPEGTEPVHPLFILTAAALDMDWQLAIPQGEGFEKVIGMTVGTKEYMNRVYSGPVG
jgi:hypothetical protein